MEYTKNAAQSGRENFRNSGNLSSIISLFTFVKTNVISIVSEDIDVKIP